MFVEDYSKKESKIKQTKAICFIIFFLSLLLSFELSSSNYGIKDYLLLLNKKISQIPLSNQLKTAETILLHIRLPRIIVASLCGSALGVAGVLSQGLFRNSLASPSLIGSTSGATLGAVLCFTFGKPWTHILSIPLAAMTGSLITTSLLLIIYKHLKSSNLTHLLLIGLTFSTLSNALCSLMISLEETDLYKSFTIYRWLLGGFHNVEWSHFWICLAPLSFGIFSAFKLCAKLDLLCLGEDIAQTLGVEIKTMKIACLLILSLLLGVISSVAGSIPFIGLMAPHITRTLIGSHHRELMKYTVLNSASLVLLADIIAKKALVHKELELGIVLSLMGSPFFLYLIIRKKNFGPTHS